MEYCFRSILLDFPLVDISLCVACMMATFIEQHSKIDTFDGIHNSVYSLCNDHMDEAHK